MHYLSVKNFHHIAHRILHQNNFLNSTLKYNNLNRANENYCKNARKQSDGQPEKV